MGQLERALEISDLQIGALLTAKWEGWAATQPSMRAANASDADSLRRWLSDADRADHDPVLRALAQLAATDGADDRDAARLLAWVMRPAAIRLIRVLGSATDRFEDRLAAALWIEVRTCSWQTPFPIASNIARRLRRHLVAEAIEETPQQILLLPDELEDAWRRGEAHSANVPVATPPSLRLLAVLEQGCQEGVISEADRTLLLDVIATATELAECHGVGFAPTLTGDRVSDELSNRWRISGRTIRRRTRRTIAALTRMAACAA